MRVRDSGMPDEDYWESLFDVPAVLARLRLAEFHNVAEFGCGYGTFTEPLARLIDGRLYAFDIDPVMVERTRARCRDLPVHCEERDVLSLGFGISVDAVLLFNILHCQEPVALLQLAADALHQEGRVVAIHWQYAKTPRGPSLDVRPKPHQIAEWAECAGLTLDGGIIDLPPWHFGMRFKLPPAHV